MSNGTNPVVTHSRRAKFDKVSVSYRRPWRPGGSAASRAALREVERLLDGIAREALGLR